MRRLLFCLIASLVLIAPAADAKARTVKNAEGRAIKTVMPVYPPLAQENGIEGRMQVAPNNRIRLVEVAESSGSPLLDEAAVAAVRQYRFQAASRDGKRIATTFFPIFKFELE